MLFGNKRDALIETRHSNEHRRVQVPFLAPSRSTKWISENLKHTVTLKVQENQCGMEIFIIIYLCINNSGIYFEIFDPKL